MKILFDGQVFVHQKTGGISRYFANLVAGLNEVPGCSARVVAPLYRNEHLIDLRRETQLPLAYGIGMPTALRTGRICAFVTGGLSSALSRVLKSDIVHETYFAAKPYLPRARRRVTTVYDMVHEIYSPGHPTTEHKRASLARCDHVLCISHNTKKDLCEIFGYPPEKATVVHLGYQDFSRTTGDVPPGIGTKPYILYVGQRSGYKNFGELLKAFAASASLQRDVQVVTFGGGALTGEERELARGLGLEETAVVQVGGSDAVLAGLYRGAVALVYPSLYEGFGLPPLEAMSAGCPVVCSNSSSLPEVVGDAALTFDPASAEDMRVCLERVVQSQALRDDLVARGHEQRRRFTWQRCVAETLETYRRVT